MMRACAPDRDRTDDRDFIDPIDVREFRHLGRRLVASCENLGAEHLGDPLGRLSGIVIPLDVDHQRTQQIADPGLDLRLKLLPVSRLEILGNVLICAELAASFFDPGPNRVRNSKIHAATPLRRFFG